MPKAELSRLHKSLDRHRQLQQTKKVTNASAIFPRTRRHLLLSHLELTAQTLKWPRLLHRIKVSALKVLDDGHLHGLFVGYLAHDRWNCRLARYLRRPPAPLTHNQLIAP